jgi:hypothetical protein
VPDQLRNAIVRQKPRIRPATNYERGMGILGEQFDTLLKQPALRAAGKVAEIAGNLTDWGIRGNTAEDPDWKSGALVFHGSPHSFKKFDFSKIGSGEGSQAFGHGLYFADNPEVARFYAKLNGEPIINYVDTKLHLQHQLGAPEGWQMAIDKAARSNIAGRVDNVATLADTLKRMKLGTANDLRHITQSSGGSGAWAQTLKGRLTDYDTALEQLARGAVQVKAPAQNLYQVHIPDSAISKMLVYDREVAAQPKNVLDAFGKLDLLDDFGGPRSKIYSGKDVYDQIADRAVMNEYDDMLGLGGLDQQLEFAGGGNRAASQVLDMHGVPGLRFFDKFSRGSKAGSNTSNYVTFSDRLPQIVKTNPNPDQLTLGYRSPLQRALQGGRARR